MTTAYIGIGSNIDRDIHIPASLNALEITFGKLLVSSIYEAEAVGFSGDSFYNLVVGFDSDWAVTDIMKQLRQIEANNLRTRDGAKFSAHTLDLDLLLYGNLIIDEGKLQIPRKDIEDCAFVLEPLAEIAPDALHPVRCLSYKTLWEQFNKTTIKQSRVKPSWANQYRTSLIKAT